MSACRAVKYRECDARVVGSIRVSRVPRASASRARRERLRRRRRRSRHRLSPSAFADSFARGRRGASLKRSRRVHGGAHVPSAARLASRLGDRFRHSRRRRRRRAPRGRRDGSRETRRPRTSVHVDAVVERARSSSNSRGVYVLGVVSRAVVSRRFGATTRGERWIRRRRASRRGPREGLLVRRGRARFSRWRGGGVGGATRELARGDGRASAAPPGLAARGGRRPRRRRRGGNGLVSMPLVASRGRGARPRVGARGGGGGRRVVRGDFSRGRVDGRPPSLVSRGRVERARRVLGGRGRLGDRGRFLRAPLGRRPSLLARPRARARLRELLRARHLARRVHDPTEDSIDERADLVGVAHGGVTVVD